MRATQRTNDGARSNPKLADLRLLAIYQLIAHPDTLVRTADALFRTLST